MNSPVEIPYQSLIVLDKSSKTSVYMQIANQIINAIQRSYLVEGQQLLGSRQMSLVLKVHRNTVVAAYDELELQGWIKKVPNVGCFVLNAKSDVKNRFIEKDISLKLYPEKSGFSFDKSSILSFDQDNSQTKYSLNDGIPDIRLTEVELSSRIYSSNLKRKSNRKTFGLTSIEGNLYFRKNLANFLNLSRGLHISSQNITITRSLEMCIFIVAEILLRPKDLVIVAELSYHIPNMIFNQKGARIKTIPVDENGIDTNVLRKICEQEKPRLLYLTPHHHYPTTVTLSAERRIELLELSKEFNFVILEDDYDYDFHFDHHPILPLASADQIGNVIYVGSFGKSLAPGFRTGFIVAPEDFIQETKKFLNILDRQGDVLTEQVLGELIEEGTIHRYLKKANKIYKERRDFLASELHLKLNDFINFQVPSGGLAFWIEWKNIENLMLLKAIANEKQLNIPQTILYQNKNITAMRFGFGHLDLEEIEKIVGILRESLDKSY